MDEGMMKDSFFLSIRVRSSMFCNECRIFDGMSWMGFWDQHVVFIHPIDNGAKPHDDVMIALW